MRIFIGLNEVAGYCANLKKGFEELGIKSTFIDLPNHKFNYGSNDNDIFWVKIGLKIKNIKEGNRNKLVVIFFNILHLITRIILFIQMFLSHDVFIFFFATSFLKYKDLPILKFFNKKIIYVFLGSDSRPPYINGAMISKSESLSLEECINLISIRKKNILTIDKYADYIIDHIPQALFHERKFIPLSYIGIPFHSNYSNATSNNLVLNENKSLVKILHSPSHPELKGSAKIKEVINNIKLKGYNIEFIEVIGMPNKYVIEKINECDFVIDQIYSDTPMAAFATESSYFGKPVIVCGYYVDYIKKYTDENLIPPTIYCRLDELEGNIIKLITDIDYRKDIGNRAKDFVIENLAPKVVAEKYLKIINDQFDKKDLFDPKNIDYIYGGGIEKSYLKEYLSKLINKYGIKSLQLDDKPELEKKIMDFIEK